MNPRLTLGAALRAAGRELDERQAPPIDAAVFAALPAPPRERAAPRWRRPMAWSGAAACAALLIGSALLMLRPGAERLRPELEWARASGFVPVAPAEHWVASGDEGPAWLVLTELPGDRLAALGLPYDPENAGERVRAELLLQPSGEVLAVRFLR